MASYLVQWDINIEADSPCEAAEKALRIQRNPDSIATVFIVHEEGSDSYTYDLSESEVRNPVAEVLGA